MDFSEVTKDLIADVDPDTGKVKSSVSKKRRRRVETKIDSSIKGCNKRLMVRPVIGLGGAVSYLVRSASDPTKMYQVTGRIDGIDFKMNCSCGEQFGMRYRDNCKHILATIIFQMKNYIQVHFDEKDVTEEKSIRESDLSKISDMIENLSI